MAKDRSGLLTAKDQNFKMYMKELVAITSKV